MSDFSPLFLIVGPSGSGKSTLARNLTKLGVPEIISHTSRAMREGEVDGVNYHYVTRERFEALVESGDMIEHVEYNGNLYGVARSSVEDKLRAGPACLVVEAGGARQVKNAYGPFTDVTTIFIFPPDADVLRERMLARGDNPAVVEARLASVEEEVKRSLFEDPSLVNAVVDGRRSADEVVAAVRSLMTAA